MLYASCDARSFHLINVNQCFTNDQGIREPGLFGHITNPSIAFNSSSFVHATYCTGDYTFVLWLLHSTYSIQPAFCHCQMTELCV